MKVLQINATYGLGSTGTIVRDLKECCEANGIECYVAYAKTSEKVERGYKIGNWFFNKLHALLARIAGKQAYFSVVPTLMFIRFMNKLQPDVVHLHNLHSNYINLPMLLKYLAKNDIRTIITLHDCWWYTGGCCHYMLANCNKWLDMCGNCPKKKQDRFLIDKSVNVLSDRKELLLSIPRLTIVGVSEWVSAQARQSFLLSVDITTIYNGIDLTVFKPTPSTLKQKLGLEGKYIILGPASKWLQPYNKDLLDYFSANMKSDEILLLYGAETANVKLSSNIYLYPYTTNRCELTKLYSCADIFVNPSYEDTLSLINLEAQACGTPVITYNLTGTKETVDGQVSLSVCPNDFEQIIKVNSQIRNLSDKNNLVRDFIKDKFNLNLSTGKYVELYNSTHN